MEKLVILTLLVLTGCASHIRKDIFETPSTTVVEQCSETANGSTACFTHVRKEVDDPPPPPAVGYSPYGAPYGMPYAVPPMMYAAGASAPPAHIVLQAPTTSGQRAMERVGGGYTVSVPMEISDPRVNQLAEQVGEHEQNLDVLNRATGELVRRAKAQKEGK